MKKLILINLLFAIAIVSSCDLEILDPDEQQEEINLDFDLSGAKAILLQDAASQNGRLANDENANLFKVDTEGNVSPVIDSVEVVFVRAFAQGLYVELNDERSSSIRRFYVELDNSYEEIEEEIGIYRGANDNGDLIFSDVSILRAGSITVDKLQTTLNEPSVQSVSGNLAIITDFSVYQIFNTITNVRYNVQGCNGPRMQAFSGSEKALLDDCTNDLIIDMATGERSGTEIQGWNHESIETDEGVVVLSQSVSISDDFDKFGLALIAEDGTFTLITERIFQPGSESCVNCGTPNAVLYGTDRFLIVRELNKVSMADRDNDNMVSSILDGLNVTKISLSDNILYYLAESNTGSPVAGFYNLITMENTVLDDQTLFEDIQTF